MSALVQTSRPGKTVVIIGLGNIGANAVDFVARDPRVGTLILVDPQRYESANLTSQRIRLEDVGCAKTEVQSRHVALINPALVVRSHPAPVEQVPLGHLRAHVILACLDSLEARLAVNQAAWRLGVPWLDAGVEADGCLVRVNAYRPAAASPCFECALEVDDYRHLGARHPCLLAPTPAPPTGAPAALGALAASLLALECSRILDGESESPLCGRELVLDARHQRHFLTARRRSPSCLFDHRTWQLKTFRGLSRGSTVGELLAAARAAMGRSRRVSLAVPGRVFHESVACVRCGHRVERFHLQGRWPEAERQCPVCHEGGLLAPGFEAVPELNADLPPRVRRLPAQAVGLRSGDVLRASDGERECHLVIPDETM